MSKSELVAKDFLGNQLNVGDTVVFITNGYREFTTRKVTRIGPKKVQVGIDRWDVNVTHRYHKDVIKINPEAQEVANG